MLKHAVFAQCEEARVSRWARDAGTNERRKARRAWPCGAGDARRKRIRRGARALHPGIGFIVAPEVPLLIAQVSSRNHPARPQLLFHTEVVLHYVRGFDGLRVAEHQRAGKVRSIGWPRAHKLRERIFAVVDVALLVGKREVRPGIRKACRRAAVGRHRDGATVWLFESELIVGEIWKVIEDSESRSNGHTTVALRIPGDSEARAPFVE